MAWDLDWLVDRFSRATGELGGELVDDNETEDPGWAAADRENLVPDAQAMRKRGLSFRARS